MPARTPEPRSPGRSNPQRFQDVGPVKAAVVPPNLVVMGVAGCGKSSVGRALADALGVSFVEGDSAHPPENIARMQAGIALTDADRAGWLATLARCLADAVQHGEHVVITCSALKRSYRDTLRGGDPDVFFVLLHGTRALIEQRMRERSGHFMPLSLIDSQFAALEPPAADERAFAVDVGPAPSAIVAQVLAALEHQPAR
jgi:gluconokinase